MFRVADGVSIRLQRFAFVIWVHIAGQRPRFVSFAAFKRHFAERRQLEANSLSVDKDPGFENLYIVGNPAKSSRYYVAALDKKVDCTCEDFKNQSRFFGRACCKHAYAVLFQLGYANLRDYIARA